MKTTDGYTLRRSQSGYSDYEIKIFSVDACNYQGNPEQGLFDREYDGRYPTLKQAVAHCKKYKDTCDMFEIWEEWHDCEPSRYGGYSIGDVNSQIVHQYKGGKLVGKDTLL